MAVVLTRHIALITKEQSGPVANHDIGAEPDHHPISLRRSAVDREWESGCAGKGEVSIRVNGHYVKVVVSQVDASHLLNWGFDGVWYATVEGYGGVAFRFANAKFFGAPTANSR